MQVNENPTLSPTPGTVGVESHVGGSPATVSAAANATEGIAAGNFVEPDIDEDLFNFNSQDTPLMNLMLKARKVKVSSPEVEHFMIDEQKSFITTVSAYTHSTTYNATLKLDSTYLASSDLNVAQEYTTLLARGVHGYAADGVTETTADIMFIVTEVDSSGYPTIRPCNGPKNSGTMYIPTIPAGTRLTILANALYETQKEVAPDLIVPQPTTIYLQKRGMNSVVSDYFDAQKKRIPFSQAIIAEQAIATFKTKGNRTLWAGRKSKLQVRTKLGSQMVHTTEGIRWQFRKELRHTGKWTIEKLIALAKMFYTGEDVPKSAIALCGKDFLEQIQCIDYSEHPEIQITVKTNSIGWAVTNIHTVFGDFELKHEPTLDKLGWSKSCALIGTDRLVHYVYSNEHSFNEKVDGEEAKRSGILVWDGLALKGACHIWVDGEDDSDATNAAKYVLWDSATAPTGSDLVAGTTYYLLTDVAGVGKASEYWKYDGSAWKEVTGEVSIS